MIYPTICNFNLHTSVGGTQHTLALALSQLKPDFDVRVIDPYKNNDFIELMRSVELSVIPVYDLSHRPYVSNREGWQKIPDFLRQIPDQWRLFSRLRHYIKEENVKLVYVNQVKSALIASVVVPKRIPIIYHCHGVAATGITLVIRLRRKYARIIANSPYTTTQLLKLGVEPYRIFTLTNTMPIKNIKNQALEKPILKLPIPQQRPVILVAHAGIEPNKGTHLVVEAMSALATKGLPGELWVVGEEPLSHQAYVDKVKAQIEVSNIVDRVHFLGRRSDIYAVMNQADIVVVPSLVDESFGRVAAEALVLGKVVVVSNRGALPFMIQDGETGCVFDVSIPDALEKTLCSLIESPEKCIYLSSQGINYAEQNFDQERYGTFLRFVFQEALGMSESERIRKDGI